MHRNIPVIRLENFANGTLYEYLQSQRVSDVEKVDLCMQVLEKKSEIEHIRYNTVLIDANGKIGICEPGHS
jgi:hypothetical protein